MTLPSDHKTTDVVGYKENESVQFPRSEKSYTTRSKTGRGKLVIHYSYRFLPYLQGRRKKKFVSSFLRWRHLEANLSSLSPEYFRRSSLFVPSTNDNGTIPLRWGESRDTKGTLVVANEDVRGSRPPYVTFLLTPYFLSSSFSETPGTSINPLLRVDLLRRGKRDVSIDDNCPVHPVHRGCPTHGLRGRISVYVNTSRVPD